MDTISIKNFLKNYTCFKGVFPSDRLPYRADLPLHIIVNTDPSNKPGQHWVCVSIDKLGRGYYFDSFGLPPMVNEIEKFLNQRAVKGWKFNKLKIQNALSSTCGNYCVLYIIFKCVGISQTTFLKQFVRNSKQNDIKMLKLFKNFTLVCKSFKSNCRSNKSKVSKRSHGKKLS